MKKSEEKRQYESLTSYFKYLVTITLSAITLVCAVAGFLFWNSGKEMREEYNQKKEELQKGFESMEQDLKEQKSEMQFELDKLTTKTNNEIGKTRIDAIGEIENIKITASEKAEFEARNKINQVFTDKNFDDFVAKIAKERMEPQINKLVDQKFASNEIAATDEAVENLTSNDRVKFIGALNYLQINPRIKLNEQQIKKVINSIDVVDPNYKISFMAILLFRKSEPSTSFFRNQLETGENSAQVYAFQYFAFNNIDFDIFSESIYKLIKKNSNAWVYSNAVTSTKDLNKDYALKLLNSRELINLSKSFSIENFETVKNSLRENLKTTFTESEINSTLLYKASH